MIRPAIGLVTLVVSVGIGWYVLSINEDNNTLRNNETVLQVAIDSMQKAANLEAKDTKFKEQQIKSKQRQIQRLNTRMGMLSDKIKEISDEDTSSCLSSVVPNSIIKQLRITATKEQS